MQSDQSMLRMRMKRKRMMMRILCRLNRAEQEEERSSQRHLRALSLIWRWILIIWRRNSNIWQRNSNHCNLSLTAHICHLYYYKIESIAFCLFVCGTLFKDEMVYNLYSVVVVLFVYSF